MFQKKRDTKPLELHVKEWYIIFENQQEGPFSLLDLKKDPRFTPDTLVWKKGFQEWIPSRFVPEIKELFKDEPESKPLHEYDKEKKLKGDLGQDQITLTLQQDPYQFILWFLLILLILFYSFYQFFSR